MAKRGTISAVDKAPELEKEYSSENDKPLSAYSYGSKKRVKWVCSKNPEHTWEAIIKTRVRGAGCPYCRYVHKDNLLADKFPHIAAEYAEDNPTSLCDISSRSKKVVKWVCSKDSSHTWELQVAYRVRYDSTCPHCRQLENSIVTTHPHLAKQYADDNEIPVEEISHGMARKVKWVCDKDSSHTWVTSVSTRAKTNSRCPMCMRQESIKPENLLKNSFPSLRNEYSDNNPIPFNEVSRAHNKAVEWVCSVNPEHVWESAPRTRTKSRNGGITACPFCVDDDVALPNFSPLLAKEYSPNNPIPVEDISRGTGRKVEWVCSKDPSHIWKAVVKNRTGKGSGCPHCAKVGVSQQEKQLRNLVREYVGEEEKIVYNDRTLLGRKELDIYLPERNMAIEYNGLYWHTEEQGKGRSYHKEKWEKCRDKGVQLITIWEDDWRDRQDIVKSMLAHKLGVSGDSRVFARKTVVRAVDSTVARYFCNLHHIQGACGGTYYLGLYTKDSNELVAVSVWRKHKKDMYLDRYCTSKVVVGGFSKLLTHAKALFTQDGFDRIVTFADREVSDGNLYECTGFVVDSYLKPDYRYIFNGKRYHKFGFRSKRFKNDPELLYQAGLTEGQLAELNGLCRIWDCGKIKYVLTLKDTK